MDNYESFFPYDKLIYADNFCNFKQEQKTLLEAIKNKKCVKIYGPRNFGKTSLVKNIVGLKWEQESPKNRIIIYADFFSVTSLEDISMELTQAFNKAISQKRNLRDKSVIWLNELKNLRPVWQVPASPGSLGDFSLRTEDNEKVIDFELLLENIERLQKKKQFEFLIIFDEFQEIHKIKKAEAKLRGALQNFSVDIPIVALGSKQHIIQKIFHKSRSPFYSWGETIEMRPIAYDEYFSYIKERFDNYNIAVSVELSKYIQDCMFRVPENINRFCDYIVKNVEEGELSKSAIDLLILDFVDKSRSIYEEIFSYFKENPRKVVLALAKLGKVYSINGTTFILTVAGISKTGITDIVERLLDESVITKNLDDKGKSYYQLNDPFFVQFLKSYKLL
jgi:AAA+ ATPase superfamily predicted ATPase